MEEQKRPLPIVLRVFMVVALVAVVGIIVYFGAFRIENGDYIAATKHIDIMQTKAKEITAQYNNPAFNAVEVTEEKLSEVSKLILDYENARKALEQSTAVTRDGQVVVEYNKVKQQASQYSQEIQGLVKTVAIMADVLQNCELWLDQIPSISSVVALNESSKDCRDAMEKNESVPHTDYNELFFDKYRDGMINVLSAVQDYYVAGQDGNVAKQAQAQTMIKSSLAVVDELYSKSYSLSNSTTHPREGLSKLKTVLVERSSVILR